MRPEAEWFWLAASPVVSCEVVNRVEYCFEPSPLYSTKVRQSAKRKNDCAGYSVGA
jgi:hypothetical protein